MSRVQLNVVQRLAEGGRVRGNVPLFVYDHGTTNEVTGFTTEAGTVEVTYPLFSNNEGRYPDAWYPTGSYDLFSPDDTIDSTVRWEAINAEDAASSIVSTSDDEAITGAWTFGGTAVSDFAAKSGAGTVTADWNLAPTGGAGTVTLKDLAVDREAPWNINYPEFGGSLTTAITAANAASGDRLSIYVPGNATVATKGTLTRGDVSIFGDGPSGSKISLTGAELLQIGDDGGSSISNVTVEGLVITASGGTATDHLFELRNCGEVTVSDLRVADIAGLVSSGSSTQNAGRYTFRNISGNYNGAGTNTKVIEHVNGSGLHFERVRITSSAYLSSTLAYAVFIKPAATGNVIDTVRFDQCEIWGDFQQYGVEVFTQNEKVVNLFFNGCVFDATVLAGMRIHSGATGKEFRNLWCTDTRFDTNNGGNAVQIQWATTEPFAGAHFIGCKLGDGDDVAVVSNSTNEVVSGLEFIGCQVEDGAGGTTNPAAFQFGHGGWSAIGNRFYERSAGAGDTNYAIQTTADVANFVAVGNTAPDVNTGFFNHFAYAADDTSRVVRGNIPEDEVGFFGKTGVAKQTGVAVTEGGIHAALVNLGLISA